MPQCNWFNFHNFYATESPMLELFFKHYYEHFIDLG